jgi:hypothetical protein
VEVVYFIDLIFSLDYHGNDLKTHFKELYSECENLSYYIKELFIFIKEKGLMDKWTARQARQMEKNLVEKCGNNSENQEKAFSAFQSHLFNNSGSINGYLIKNSGEMIILLTSGKHTEFNGKIRKQGREEKGGREEMKQYIIRQHTQR